MQWFFIKSLGDNMKILNIAGIILGGILMFVPPFVFEPMTTMIGLALVTYNLYKMKLLGK